MNWPLKRWALPRSKSASADSAAAHSGLPLALWALSISVGIIAGLGAAVFRALIAFFHNLLFLGKLSIAYDANAHTPPSPWGRS